MSHILDPATGQAFQHVLEFTQSDIDQLVQQWQTLGPFYLYNLEQAAQIKGMVNTLLDAMEPFFGFQAYMMVVQSLNSWTNNIYGSLNVQVWAEPNIEPHVINMTQMYEDGNLTLDADLNWVQTGGQYTDPITGQNLSDPLFAVGSGGATLFTADPVDPGTGSELPAGSIALDETTWLAPDGTFWTQNPDGTWVQKADNTDQTGNIIPPRPNDTAIWDPATATWVEPGDLPPVDGTLPEGVPDGSVLDPVTGIWTAPDGTQYVDDENPGIFVPLGPTDFVDPGIPGGFDPGENLDREVELSKQSNDQFFDAVSQFFPGLNAPGQQTLLNASQLFETGFDLRGGVPQGDLPAFETYRQFIEQGGSSLNALQALQAMQQLAEYYQGFGEKGFFDQFEPNQKAAIGQSLLSQFGRADQGSDAAFGFATERYNNLFNTFQTNLDPLIGAPLRSAFDFQRKLFNADRQEPTDDFFIDDFISGFGEEFFSAFDQPSGVNFF